MGAWSTLEYVTISRESAASGCNFYLTSVPALLVENLPQNLKSWVGKPTKVTSEEVTGISGNGRMCLLDPRAEKELAPEDAESFDWFVFGGILGRYIVFFFFLVFCCLTLPILQAVVSREMPNLGDYDLGGGGEGGSNVPQRKR